MQTPRYEGTYVFVNDFSALIEQPAAVQMDVNGAGLLQAETETGLCHVLCFDPRHDLTLATMPVGSIRRAVDAWIAEELELGAREEIAYVQIFENRGSMMGASNPHPHCQTWATGHLPDEPAAELAAQEEYRKQHGRPLLLDYLELELAQAERIVAENASWVALVPFWAVWPFELMLLPRAWVPRLAGQTEDATGRPGGSAEGGDRGLQPRVRCAVSLLDGLSPGAGRREGTPGMAVARALLSPAAALGHRAQVHGRVRAAGLAAKRYYARKRG